MALKIENEKIIGIINNLEDKLEGKLPVDILELIHLVNSWGRIDFFYTQYLDEVVKIENCRSKECYDLSKLDVSKITSMENLFKYSLFTDIHSTNGIGLHDGDISKWDVSNVTSMKEMFFSVESFNQPIGNWDVSSVTNMSYMFSFSKNFNQNILNWNLNSLKTANLMFHDAKAFCDKYNNGNPLPEDTYKTKEWFNLNRERINMIEIKEKHGEEIDNFFSIINNNEMKKDK